MEIEWKPIVSKVLLGAAILVAFLVVAVPTALFLPELIAPIMVFVFVLGAMFLLAAPFVEWLQMSRAMDEKMKEGKKKTGKKAEKEG